MYITNKYKNIFRVMSTNFSSLSLQESAIQYAKSMALNINAAAAEVAGVEVLWFRAKPDKRSQDVIFQSYTLYGVEDCPLKFKAVYSDTGYDDAAITYNIMGLEYAIPLTLEIALKTWTTVTEEDGSLPQRGDVVFIPISNKLVEVVSMTPVKAIGAQITSYKVNCSIYKPTRSRLVGENLKESIETNTENLYSRFGEDIKNVIDNVVDDKQLSMFNSTSKDKHKEVKTEVTADSLITDKRIRNIISQDLTFDGHIVARTYYDMSILSGDVVKYKTVDKFVEGDERCLSLWALIKDHDKYTNIKKISVDTTPQGFPIGSYIYIDEYSGKRLSAGEHVVIERGNIVICGVVDDNERYRIVVHPNIIKGLTKSIKNWWNLTGYIIRKDNQIPLLKAQGSSYDVNITIKGNNYIALNVAGNEVLVQLNRRLKCNVWYGFIINFGSTISVDVFEGEPQIKQICGISGIKCKFFTDNEMTYTLNGSNSYLTNIRLYDVSNNELDKQITDLVSYNTPYNSHAIINDTADTPLNKEYIGEQR